MSIPSKVRIACVGRTNEGKSSVVAALSENDQITISDAPGTTKRNQVIQCQVNGEVLMELYDTPGFEDAEAVLAWLKQHNDHAAQRPSTVASFLNEFRGSDDFVEEQTLLKPMLEDGADILYIVDGSHPFNRDFESEMEVLQWCGRPRMALINPKHGRQHVDDWKRALGQYFSVVRVFDAHDVSWEPRLSLLKAFRELQDDDTGRQAVDVAVSMLEEQRRERPRRAAALMLETMIDCCTRCEEKVYKDHPPAEDQLREQLCRHLEARWQSHQKSLEQLYRHNIVHREVQGLGVKPFSAELFSERSWELFGLSKTSCAVLGGMVGVSSGAPIGGVIDFHTGGASFFTGTILGTVVGGGLGAVTAWLAGDRLGELKIMGQSLSQNVARFGPISNPRFPWILLDLMLLHHVSISQRSHAKRDKLEVKHEESASSGLVERLSKGEKQILEKAFRAMRSQDRGEIEKSRSEWVKSLESLL